MLRNYLRLVFAIVSVFVLFQLFGIESMAQQGNDTPMIRDILVEKDEVCAGESFWVVVRALQPSDPMQSVDILIDNKPGAIQQIQLDGKPGVRYVPVSAASGQGQVESQLIEVRVLDCGEEAVFPLLNVRLNPYHPLTVDLQVPNSDELVATGVEIEEFIWDFGDGKVMTTTVPYASHDYRYSLDMGAPSTSFDAVVRVAASDQELTATKSVTIWNVYHFNKQQGFIQPHVTIDSQLGLSNALYSADYRVKNFEDESLEITSTQREEQLCDVAADSRYTAVENPFNVIDAQAEVTGTIAISATAIPEDVCGLAYHFKGKTSSNVDAAFSLYTEVRENEQRQQLVTDEAILDLLNEIAEQGLVDDPDFITYEDLYRLELEGRIPNTGVFASREGTVTAAAVQAPQYGSGIGEQCRPGDEPPRPGVACLATRNMEIAPPYIANAKKGDIVLSPGCGMIGNLLRMVEPEQFYSHTGIMTRNYDEITHSTASEERYVDYPIEGFFGNDIPAAGIRPDILKYGWPGVIRQTVEEAIEGAYYLDPESRKEYRIRGFKSDPVWCDLDENIFPPLIVKPSVEADSTVRPVLHEAADIAANYVGKAHYRLGAYSDADAMWNSIAPQDAGWAAGTRGMVCTSFIWGSLREAGVAIEGDSLELTDIGGEKDGQTLDGLYLYQADERLAAAEWLYSDMHSLVHDKIIDEAQTGLGSIIGSIVGNVVLSLDDVADDVANQLVNCFAFDDCRQEATDSKRWREPGVGRAVSPQDILFWDAPSTGGVYGYNEEMVYRVGHYRRVYTWQPVEGEPVWNVNVTVLRDGEPEPFADVILDDNEVKTTDANGMVTFGPLYPGGAQS